MAELIGILIVSYALIAGITFILWRVIKAYSPRNWQEPLMVASGAVLCAPSFAPAPIVAVPLPYGITLMIGVYIGALNESFDIAVHFWQWHLISFFSTAFLILLGLRITKKVREKLRLIASQPSTRANPRAAGFQRWPVEMKDHLKRIGVLIVLGLILGMFLALWFIAGDRLYTRHGTLVLLLSLVFHAGVLPVLFAYVGARIWSKRPFLAGWIVSAIPAIGAAFAATAVYITTPKGEFNVGAASNNWRDASLEEFIRLAIQSIPAALEVLAWVLVVGAVGAGIAVVHMKLKRNGQQTDRQVLSESAASVSSEKPSS